MYRILRVAVGGFVAVLALGLAAPVGADVIINEAMPYSETTENTCTGEFIELAGTVHTVVRASVSAGGQTHFGGSSEFGGLKGTTLDGVRYVETKIENFGGSFDSDFMPTEANTETLQILTRLGEDGTFVNGDDLRVHISAHVTVNANGTVIVDRTDSTVECK